MTWVWSVVLAAVGIAGLWVAGLGRKLGWAMGLGAQILWIGYAIATAQWGFIVSALAYGFVYGRNWWRWHRREQQESRFQPLTGRLDT